MPDVDDLMKGLARERPVFHSEADFQHALAWRIHEVDRDARIRLEWPVQRPDSRKRIYVDVYLPNRKVAVELKYVTQKLRFKHEDECFNLRFQSAQDTRRYDFLKDIQRLEQLYLSARAGLQSGFAILLTNDPLYWEKPSPGWEKANDAQFRLHKGRTIHGKMEWSTETGPGTMGGREDPICLNGSYPLRWRDYAEVSDSPFRKFRYLAIQVGYPSKLGEPQEPC